MRFLIGALLSLGCATTVVPSTIPQRENVVIGVENRSLTDASKLAISLWWTATDGAFDPNLVWKCNDVTVCIREVKGSIAECNGEEGSFNGCFVDGEILIADNFNPKHKTDAIMHQIGHFLKIRHQAWGLMDPDRDPDVKVAACIDDVTLSQLPASWKENRRFNVVCLSGPR